jgi:hypothetical protein
MNHQSQFPDPVVDQPDVNVVMKKEMNITHLTVMNVVIVHDCMIKEQVQNVDTSAVIVGLLVQPIINVVDLGAIHHLEVEMKRCIIDTIDIKNGHIQSSEQEVQSLWMTKRDI